MKTEKEKEGGATGAPPAPPSVVILHLISVSSVTLW